MQQVDQRSGLIQQAFVLTGVVAVNICFAYCTPLLLRLIIVIERRENDQLPRRLSNVESRRLNRPPPPGFL